MTEYEDVGNMAEFDVDDGITVSQRFSKDVIKKFILGPSFQHLIATSAVYSNK